MKKWEYGFIDFKDKLIDLNELDNYGKQGWELVCVKDGDNGLFGVVKRQIEENTNNQKYKYCPLFGEIKSCGICNICSK